MEHLYHFDLSQDPFQNEPDLRFYFESGPHRQAQLRVDRGLRQSKGLCLLTGEGGTGKTLVARSIFESLEEEVFEANLMVMMQGAADALSVMRRFARQLGAEEPAAERATLMAQIYDHLAIVREDGRHAVLIVDDAHVLSPEALAEVGALLNLEYEDRRLLSLLLVGLPELDAIVSGDLALGQRVDVRVCLQPLGEADAGAYLAHRIQAAGGNAAILGADAVAALAKSGGGRPRLMNTLADNALFEAYLGGRTQLGAADVERAAADLGLEGTVAAPAPAPVRAAAAPLAEATVRIDAPTPPATTLVVSEAPELEEPDDLASLLESSQGDLATVLHMAPEAAGHTLELDQEVEAALSEAPGAEPIVNAEPTPLPVFRAENVATGSATAEPTRIALPDEGANDISFSGDSTSDEIEDLFVELLDD